jgi:hypothetical protein
LDLKSLDWRSLQKYFSSRSANDLNAFLEELPQLAGQTVLIAAAIAWTTGAGIGLFSFMQGKQMTAMRAQLRETQALKPSVPTIKDVPVPQADVQKFVAEMAGTYKDVSVKQQGASIFITSPSTTNFGEFRESIGHVQNGGSGWRVSVDALCVGRECSKDKLSATLKINKVTVENPVKQ